MEFSHHSFSLYRCVTEFLLWRAGVSRVSPEVHPSETNSWECSFCPHTAFPLIFIKHFQRSWPLDKEGPETVPEADFDFEEIIAAETVCYVGFILDLTDKHHICKCTCRTQGVYRFVILSVYKEIGASKSTLSHFFVFHYKFSKWRSLPSDWNFLPKNKNFNYL